MAHGEHDPTAREADADEDLFAPPPTTPRGRRALTVVAFLCAAGAIWIPPLGIVGMGSGAVANLKGDRPGIVAAVLSGVTTVVGITFVFLAR